MDEWQDIGARVVSLTEVLVRIHSVHDTVGEAEITQFLAEYLRTRLPAEFAAHVTTVDVPKATPCQALIAYLPAPVVTRRTLVLLGHTDTVGLGPYKDLASIALNSPALKQHYAAHAEPPVAAAAADPDWAFGRGWLDMKGGVACATEVFLREAQRRTLPAHLILMLAPDEENESRGIRALIPVLRQLLDTHGLELAHVVNTDYTAPIVPGDDRRYFYSGVVGKLLLGISVFGRTTHVGETFRGYNASAVAGYLAGALEHDRKLVVGVGGEWLPPPTVLRIADRRGVYDVMTTECAELYVNMFHLGGDAKARWHSIVQEVRRLLKRYDRELRLRYNRFTARADLALPRLEQRVEVLDYAGLRNRVATQVPDIVSLEAKLKQEADQQHRELRERALAVVRGLQAHLTTTRPLVVVSLLQPYYPAQVNRQAEGATAKLIELARSHGLKHRRVYPYIADTSYFCFGAEAGLAEWGKQSPVWFTKDELESLGAISTRVCNLGPFGVGAHTFEERVHIPYLRDKLPRIITEALEQLAD